MATVREVTRSVLLIVDAQVAVMKKAWDSPRIIANIATAVQQARLRGIPVIWVRHSDGHLPAGSPGWEFAPELRPDPGESIVQKNFASSFEETDLEKILEHCKASHIVLAGAATNFCIRATAYGALDRGYDLSLISDAHTTGTMVLGGKTISAEDIIADLNATMSWIKYPGRTNRAIACSEVDFAWPGL